MFFLPTSLPCPSEIGSSSCLLIDGPKSKKPAVVSSVTIKGVQFNTYFAFRRIIEKSHKDIATVKLIIIYSKSSPALDSAPIVYSSHQNLRSKRGMAIRHLFFCLEKALHASTSPITASRPLTSLVNLRRSFAAEAIPASTSSSRKEGVAMPPWTPTRELVKRKTLMKRMGYMLSILEKEREAQAIETRKLPDFKPGDVLELKLTVPENKRRSTNFKGVCIAKKNRGWRSSFTLRNFIGASGGIERSFPLYSPHIQDLKVLESRKVRRAKLYYLRDRVPKEYRIV